MSYNDITDDEYKPKELKDQLNINGDELDSNKQAAASIVSALEQVQLLHGDDSTKYKTIVDLALVLDYLAPDAEIEIKEQHIFIE